MSFQSDYKRLVELKTKGRHAGKEAAELERIVRNNIRLGVYTSGSDARDFVIVTGSDQTTKKFCMAIEAKVSGAIGEPVLVVNEMANSIEEYPSTAIKALNAADHTHLKLGLIRNKAKFDLTGKKIILSDRFAFGLLPSEDWSVLNEPLVIGLDEIRSTGVKYYDYVKMGFYDAARMTRAFMIHIGNAEVKNYFTRHNQREFQESYARAVSMLHKLY